MPSKAIGPLWKRRAGGSFRAVAASLLAASLAVCDSGTEPDGGDEPIDLLFAPATAAEIAAVEAEWAARAPAARAVALEDAFPLPGAGALEMRIYSHEVDAATHYGAVVLPAGASSGSLPVLLFAHPGDAGVGILEISLLLGVLGGRADDFVVVVPSFRGETLESGRSTYRSTGEPSPWDRDVDDAIALLDVALSRVPQADPARVVAVGLSRGAGVALLMGIRDPRVDAVIEIAGPTDFLSPYVREIVEDAFAGRFRDLPGVNVLDQRFIQPFIAGSLPVEQVRRELIRRSAVLFPGRLPPVQAHHGDADDVVDVSQLQRLRVALGGGRQGSVPDEFHVYPGVGHDQLLLFAVSDDVRSFLDKVTAPS